VSNHPKVIPAHDRPREKLDRIGVGALGDNELLAIVLGAGAAGRSALDLANELLAKFHGVRGLTRVFPTELEGTVGIGRVRAAQVLASVELGRRSLLPGEAERVSCTTPRELAAYLIPRFSARAVEQFGVVLLDLRHRVIRTVLLSIGTADASLAHPRDVFREAAAAGAPLVAVFHNHPSGDPRPSEADEQLTRRIVMAGDLLGIQVVDHVILADAQYFSFRQAGVIRG
jgi:DNA repair protein RadC